MMQGVNTALDVDWQDFVRVQLTKVIVCHVMVFSSILGIQITTKFLLRIFAIVPCLSFGGTWKLPIKVSLYLSVFINLETNEVELLGTSAILTIYVAWQLGYNPLFTKFPRLLHLILISIL